MILESIFSCTNLLLTCGSSIYILIKHSYTQYSKFFTHLTCACVSIAMIGSRSLIVLLYKLFIKEYSFDPDMIEIEEERNKERFNILDELLGTLSMTGLIYSLYCCHGYYILGVCVVTSLSIFNVFKLYHMIKQLEEMETSRFYNTLQQTKTISKFNVFNWVIVGGCFAKLGNGSRRILSRVDDKSCY
ncbi:uncharacterized protein LOC107994532 isoform X2 [Apis cerana]|uniref:uncharacterized protein LOC107994532 isoform X2 n=1 Tax=Apis cerana TaxID=7461 RepID=UPI00109BF1DE|nr:uncharacterized protein LOC107994532 isoform X2 [Apis cerana]